MRFMMSSAGLRFHHLDDRALEKPPDRIAGGQRVLLTEIDQRLEIVILEEDEADDVRARRLLGAESAGEVTEEPRELRLEVARHATEVLRRAEHHDVHDPH